MAKSRPRVTLTQFVLETQVSAGEAPPEQLAAVLAQVGLAGKLIARDLRRAGLIGVLGTTGETNVQGEAVKKLDTLANDTMVEVMRRGNLVCELVSEEM